jgi:hypothetical protein
MNEMLFMEIMQSITILFGVTGNRYGFDTITASGESQNLHAVVGVLAQSVEDSLTGGDNFGIFAGFICWINKRMTPSNSSDLHNNEANLPNQI